MQEVGWATQKMLVPCVQPVKQVSNQQRLATESSLKAGGAGESRTRDTQFRKLLLYPSELQPHASNSILLELGDYLLEVIAQKLPAILGVSHDCKSRP